jgi:tetratricopeptide (TPR) repeat protein
VEAVEALPGRFITRQNTEYLRTIAAFLQGDLAQTIAHARAGGSAPLSLFNREARRLLAMQCQSFLALSLALQGDPAALEESRAVEQSPSSSVDAVTRSILARAVLLERQGKREELSSLLRAEAALLIGASLPRERALVRALRRQLRGLPVADYRQDASEPASESEAAEIEAWLRKVAPQVLERSEAAPGEPAPALTPARPADAPPDLARKPSETPVAPGEIPAAPAPAWRRKLALVALSLGGLLLLLWLGETGLVAYVDSVAASRAMSTAGKARLLARTTGMAMNLVVMLPVFALAIWLYYRAFARLREMTSSSRALVAAQLMLFRGKLTEALGLLAGVSAGHLPQARVQAHLLAARVLEFQGRPAEALARCDQGIAASRAFNARASTHDIIAPELLAERAFLLAALDREAEALASLDQLEQEFPEHAFRALARFRVELMTQLRQGKLTAAAALAASRPASLPLGLREEIVCELLTALPRGKSATLTLERLRQEIADAPGVRGWIDTYTPAVLRALGRASTG